MSGEAQPKPKMKLMILSSNSHHLAQVEKYLARRDFEVVVLPDVKSFVIKAVQWQPDFVMIPVDHQQPSVRQLPRILSQVISSYVIPYASQNSTSSLMLLKKSGSSYTVSPPVTGPKVERTINKYHLDLANPEKKAQLKREAQARGGDDALMIKIEGGKGDLQKFSADQKTKMVLEALTGGNSVDIDDPGSNMISTGGSGDANSPGYNSANAYTPQASENPDDPNSSSSYLNNTGSSSGTNNNSNNAYSPSYNPQEGSNSAAGDSSINPGSFAQNPNALDPLNSLPNMPSPITTPDGVPSAAPVNPAQAPNNEAPGAPTEDELAKKPVLSPDQRDDLSKSFQHSLGFLSQDSDQKKVYQIINKVTSSSCFSITCANFKGYAIVVSATENHKLPALNQIIKNRLNEYFRQQNVEIDSFGPIAIQEVEFQPWAISQAEVLEQAHYQGEEYAIAFFPADNIEPMFQESDAKDMLCIHMDELHGDVRTEFDLYLRMNKNGKFLLYTPKDGKFLQEQRDRLILHGITEMYLKPDDKKFVYRYRAQNFLNKEIDKFLEYAALRKQKKAS